MCSVVFNLVTSLDFQPICCATTLFHFRRTRNVFVTTRIILLSSNAESSTTGGYVVDPDRSGQIEASASRNVERTRKKPSFVPNSGFQSMQHVNMNHFSNCINFILCILFIFLLWKFVSPFIYVIIYCAGAAITTLMSISDGLDLYFFRRKMEKTRSVKKEVDGRVFICRKSWHPFLYN